MIRVTIVWCRRGTGRSECTRVRRVYPGRFFDCSRRPSILPYTRKSRSLCCIPHRSDTVSNKRNKIMMTSKTMKQSNRVHSLPSNPKNISRKLVVWTQRTPNNVPNTLYTDELNERSWWIQGSKYVEKCSMMNTSNTHPPKKRKKEKKWRVQAKESRTPHGTHLTVYFKRYIWNGGGIKSNQSRKMKGKD